MLVPSFLLPVYMHATQTGLALAKNDQGAKQFLGSVIGKMEVVSRCIHRNGCVESVQQHSLLLALVNEICSDTHA